MKYFYCSHQVHLPISPTKGSLHEEGALGLSVCVGRVLCGRLCWRRDAEGHSGRGARDHQLVARVHEGRILFRLLLHDSLGGELPRHQADVVAFDEGLGVTALHLGGPGVCRWAGHQLLVHREFAHSPELRSRAGGHRSHSANHRGLHSEYVSRGHLPVASSEAPANDREATGSAQG